MKKEVKTIVYDEELKIEAYHFDGIVQPFPNHFHEFYVIGLMEHGERYLSCRKKEYILIPGNMILFNPGDNHACAQHDGGTLDYRAINIPKEIMQTLIRDITGSGRLPVFSQNVIVDEEAKNHFQMLHRNIMSGNTDFEKEEQLLFLLSHLIDRYADSFSISLPDCDRAIEQACEIMEQNYTKKLSLDQICHETGLSKSTLLRAFTRAKSMTPYLYLESLRIGKAKKLLEEGCSPLTAAMQTGFSDQSHFTNHFQRFIGLSPGNYRKIFIQNKNNQNKAHDL